MYNCETLISIIQNMDPSHFNTLCVKILQDTISPHVIQVTPTHGGKDGGRDAVLNGECTTNFIEDKTLNFWIFQFKQFKTSDRSKCFKSFCKETNETLSVHTDCDVYIFLSSVPFSGTPETGLFDKVKKKEIEFQKKYKTKVFFWDAVSICNHIFDNPKKFFFLFPSYNELYNPQIKIFDFEKKITPPSSLTEFLLDYNYPINDNTINDLFPPVGSIINPDSESGLLWKHLQFGEYSIIKIICNRVIDYLYNKDLVERYSDLHFRSYLWAKIVLAYVFCLTGEIKLSFSILNEIKPKIQIVGDSEILAWFHNIQAILYGKISEEDKSDACSTESILIANKLGLFWLETLILLRQLHRKDWHQWEHGIEPDTLLFSDTLNKATINVKYMSPKEAFHIRQLKNAVRILHLSWKDERYDEALGLANITIQGLESNDLDYSEITRMTGEIGRIHLSSEGDSEKSIKYFRESLKYLCSTMGLARLRYYLTWMAEAYLHQDNDLHASILLIAALNIHKKLYKGVKTDKSLLLKIQNLLPRDKNVKKHVSNLIVSGRFIPLIEYRTEISGSWWTSILGPIAEFDSTI